MAENLTLTDVNMTQSHGPKSTMPTKVLDGQILLPREDGKPTEAYSGTSAGVELLSNSDWKNIHGNIEDNAKLRNALYGNNGLDNEGNIIYDKESLTAISSYTRSTFDLSKFTVVGSPTITDDGIVSNTSSGNDIATPSLLLGNNWDITVQVNGVRSSNAETLLCSSGNYTYLSLGIAYKRMAIWLKDIENNNINVAYPTNVSQIDGIPYFMKLSCRFDGINYTITASASNDNGKTLVSGTPTVTTSIPYVAQNQVSWSISPYRIATNATSDLKQLSITVNGVPVFSGNKTGIDTIKPDDYTVVGSPTISADGIASYPSGGYISTNFALSNLYNKKWTIKTRIIYKRTGNYGVTGVALHSNTPSQWLAKGNLSIFNQSGTIQFHGQTVGGSEGTKIQFSASNTNIQEGDIVDLELSFDLTTYTLKAVINEDRTFTGSWTPTTEDKNLIGTTGAISANYINLLCRGGSGDVPPTNSQIDLNAFKIYVDGNLVYQPCLKIPYTLSKTGSKIVNSIYRDRVNDAYDQGFNVSYFTLQSNANQNYSITGTPTITNDKVSSFSDTSYVTSNLQSITLDKLDLYGSFTAGSSFTDSQYIMAIANDSANSNSLVRIAIDTSKRLGIGVHNNTTWTAYWSDDNYIEANKTYLYHAYYSNGHIKVDVSTDSLAYANIIDQAVTVSSSYSFGKLWLGATGATNTTYFRGSIDLSAIKQYINGKEVYSTIIEPNFTLPRGIVADKLDSLERLDNLQPAGNQKIHALKCYSDNGEILIDAEGLNDVTKYAHSTFDLSKFTVVGSPKITDDGIASGFVSRTNYITASYTSVTPTTSIEMWSKFIANNNDTNGCIICSLATSHNIRIQRNSETVVGIRGYGSGGLLCDVTGLTINNGDEVITHATITPTGATLEVWVNGVKATPKTVERTNDLNIAFAGVYIGGQYSNGNYSPTSAIDLKYQRVIIDGVEVFSGNKTGIDTIKPDDYTVVGTPTITSDGILTLADNSNCIYKQINYFGDANKFDIIYPLYLTGNNTSDVWDYRDLLNLRNGAENAFRLYSQSKNNQTNVVCYIKGNNSTIYNLQVTPNLELNQQYFIRISKKENTYGVYYKTFQTDWTLSSSNRLITSSDTLFDFDSLRFTQCSSYERIDLNAFKIYVDGNLVYQPCLKIPYTKGSEQYGGKYVNAQYLPRVKDAYEQGLANDYFTLDEVNGTYTLPMGNLYGMIENKVDKQNLVEVPAVIISTYQNGTSWYNLYSNGFCEQSGYHSTISTANTWVKVSLLKTYKDKSYSVIAVNSGDTTNTAQVKVGNSSKNDVDGFYICVSASSGAFWRTSGYLAEGEY